jgi:hypothetical protein
LKKYNYYKLTYYLITLFPASFLLLFAFARNLEYEYSLVLSFFYIIFIPFLNLFFIDFFKKVNETHTGINKLILILFIFPVFFIIPGFLYFSLQLSFCSWNGFLFWIFFNTYPSYLLSHGIAFIILHLYDKGFKKNKLILIYITFLIIHIFFLILKIYLFPQKRTLDLLIGFIHGPLYDRLIELDWHIVFFRVSHIFFFISIIISFLNIKIRLKIVLFTFFSIFSTIINLIVFDKPSISYGHNVLQKVLQKKYEGDNFTIYHNSKNISKFALTTDFHIKDIANILKLNSFSHIKVYLYDNYKTKKLYSGGRFSDFTDIYTPSIHIVNSSWPHHSLRHELVHAVASDIAFYGLGFHPNMALTEGLAMAIAPNKKSLNIHETAASIIDHSDLNIVDIFSINFWRYSPYNAYNVAGSFIDFIIKKHGIKPIISLYKGQSWGKSFNGFSSQKIINNWQNFLNNIYLKEKYEFYTKFKIQANAGVLESKCPHSKADLYLNTSLKSPLKLRQPYNWDVKKYKYWLKNLSKNGFYKYKSLKDELIFILKNNKKDINLLKKIKNMSILYDGKLEWIYIKILESDYMSLIRSDFKESERILSNLLKFSKKKYIGENLYKYIYIRFILLKSLKQNDYLNILKFLIRISDFPDTKYDNWYLNYLKILNMSDVDENYILKILNKDIIKSVPNAFYKTLFIKIGKIFYNLDKYEFSKVSFKKSLPFLKSGEIEYIKLIIKELDYYMKADVNF